MVQNAVVWGELVVCPDGTTASARTGAEMTIAEGTLVQIKGKFLNLVSPVARYLEGSLHFEVTDVEVPLNKLPEGLQFTVLKVS